MNNNKGFTLVELAIVLVIIGLLVGGVLQGQELIKQAQLRNVLSTVREYDTAVNTFRSKYNNGLPGDFNKAVAFGICTNCANATTGGGANANGNGNGSLESASAAGPTGATTYTGEIPNFFVMLTNTALIKGQFTQPAAGGNTVVDSAFPSTPVGTGLIAVTNGGLLYYLLGTNSGFTSGNLTAAASTTPAASPLGLSLTPEEAYAIDSKIDDGRPNSGATQATSRYNGQSTAFGVAASAAATDCAAGAAATSDYRFANKAKACSMRIRASS